MSKWLTDKQIEMIEEDPIQKDLLPEILNLSPLLLIELRQFKPHSLVVIISIFMDIQDFAKKYSNRQASISLCNIKVVDWYGRIRKIFDVVIGTTQKALDGDEKNTEEHPNIPQLLFSEVLNMIQIFGYKYPTEELFWIIIRAMEVVKTTTKQNEDLKQLKAFDGYKKLGIKIFNTYGEETYFNVVTEHLRSSKIKGLAKYVRKMYFRDYPKNKIRIPFTKYELKEIEEIKKELK